VSAIIPFLPFSFEEQVVIAHKYCLELQSRVRQPIALSSKKLLGNVVLRIVNDTTICAKLAREYYDPDRGARSLETAVRNEIESRVVGTYLELNDEIVESQPLENFLLDLLADGTIVVIRDPEKPRS
jgi:ATP-dependent Clp protease ATP-binding subunit ClpA